jgi:TonB family protein
MVFRERRDEGRLRGMIVVSLLFHALLLSFLFFTPSFSLPKRTFGPAYTVSLVSFPGTVLERKSEAAAVKELLKGERSGAVQKRSLEPAPIAPLRALETRKKEERELEKAMEEIRRRAAADPAPRTPPAKSVPEKQAASAQPALSSSQPGPADADQKMQAYYGTIWSRIRGNWVLPQGILPSGEIEAVIGLTILRSGAVTGMNFEKRSGNRYFDESAMKAIQKALPFPPLPAEIGGGSIEVGIRFRPADLSP